MSEWLSRIGAWLGNWNDRTSTHDSFAEASRRWRVLDRIAAWLYTFPDRRKR